MAAGNLSPLNMQAYAIDPHPRMSDGAVEAFKVDFDGIGGMFCAFAIKWPWDVNFTQVFGFPLVVFEDDAVNDIISTGNNGAGMWDQDSGNGQTWRQIQDGPGGQPAVDARFQAAIIGYTVRALEQSTDVGYFHGIIMADLQYFHDLGFQNVVDPGPPPGRVPPAVLFPPTQVGLIQSGEGIVAAQASRLTLTYGQVGVVPIP